MKQCTECQETFDLSEFHKNVSTTDGHDYRCKKCSNKHRKFRHKLKKIVPESIGKCECCGKESDKLDLDHCHNDMEFRGWLCRACNIGIGNLGDNLEGVLKAVAYLSKYTYLQEHKEYEGTRSGYRDGSETQYDLDLRN